MKVLSFGEVLWDVYPDNEYIGGAPLNFAAHLAKHNEKVWMLTAVGCDNLGDKSVEIIKSFNVNTDLITRCKDKQTGKCLVTLDENSVPKYDLLNDVAYDYITCEKLKSSFDILYFGTLAIRGKNNKEFLKSLLFNNEFKEIFVDVNIRPPFFKDETIAFAVKNATILKISEEELSIVLKALNIGFTDNIPDCTSKIYEKFNNLKIIIITCGSNGAICFDCKSGEIFSCRAGSSKAISTVGAGDSFSAAFLHKYINKYNINTCLKYATQIADYVVSQFEAVPSYDFKKF